MTAAELLHKVNCSDAPFRLKEDMYAKLENASSIEFQIEYMDEMFKNMSESECEKHAEHYKMLKSELYNLKTYVSWILAQYDSH